MIEITDGFTLISAGSDSIEDPAGARSPTGVRMVVEFRRHESLAAGQWVTTRYDFAGDGNLREGMGIAKPIGTVVHWGRTVQYRYRLSYWIAPTALMNFVAGRVRSRASQPVFEILEEARATDLSPA